MSKPLIITLALALGAVLAALMAISTANRALDRAESALRTTREARAQLKGYLDWRLVRPTDEKTSVVLPLEMLVVKMEPPHEH